jgi:hypothetical protein
MAVLLWDGTPTDNGPKGHPAALLIVRRGHLKFVRNKPCKIESYKDFLWLREKLGGESGSIF